ncbi:MAG: Y-family DNA polymerase [Ktedonobacteraceae bacterium]
MTVIALIDADNFYVSVERIFRADLQGKPVVVLSSNDANVIARSAEAKALKIQMGAPAFQIRSLVKEHGIVQISSNFSLYGDVSARFMKALALFTPVLEEYSIDEAFADLSHVPREQLREYGQRIRATVMQYVGIPVSIGIAPSKVLAKLMTEVVKHHADYEGVVSYFQLNDQERDDLLSRISVEDIWGVGQKSSTKLHLKNIFTAKQLRDADLVWIRRTLKVVGVRIVLELRGMACMPLETTTKPKQGIMSSQSFGRPIESLKELEEAVALYTSIAAMKLRKQHSLAAHLSVFVHTNFFDSLAPQYARSTSRTLPFPTAFTPDLIAVAHMCVQEIYLSGYTFKKAGVYLTHITPQQVVQADLFGMFSFDEHERKQRLMHCIDEVNRFWGRDTLFFGAIGLTRDWQMKQARKSPNYTTNWEDIMSIS